MINEKEKLRVSFKNLRRSIVGDKRKYKNEQIADRLLHLKEIDNAGTVFVYVSFADEPDTRKFITELLHTGKRVCVPVCRKYGIMDAYEINDLSELKPNCRGISEPDPDVSQMLAKDSIDAIIVPGLAFDRKGRRIGYGGGYYDRYLKGFDGYTVGVAFSECLSGTLPNDENDVSVDFIVTDSEYINNVSE